MLLTDKREIRFDGPALIEFFVLSPRAAENLGLPGGAPKEVRFHPAAKMVDVVYGKKDTLGAASVGVESLGPLLVSYCIRLKIPLPRDSDKSIRVEADSLILDFVTRYAQALPQMAEKSGGVAQAVKSWKWVQAEKPPL